jgi:hypothetical protein
MYNANAGQSGYPNMTAAEEIENGVQRFQDGGLNRYQTNPDGTYTRIVPEQIAQPQSVAEMMAAMENSRLASETGLDTFNAEERPFQVKNIISDYINPGNEGQPSAEYTPSQEGRAARRAAISQLRRSMGQDTPLGPLDPTALQPEYSLPDTQDDAMVKEYYDSLENQRTSEGRRLSELEVGPDDGPYPEGALNEEGLIDESFPSEDPAATTAATTAATATAGAGPTVGQNEVEGEFVGGSSTVEGGPTVSSSVSGVETPKDDDQRGVVATAQKALAKAINENPQDKTKSAMAKAVEEFNAAMPEYEGMSESEKGFAIMEAGLRIMAGKSSDALTNIAEGLKGLGPKFAKDAKEKRAWNRQVNLSAAKYGLEKIAKDAAEDRADSKAEGKLDSRVWILNEGESHPGLKPGEGIMLTVAQMRDSTVLGKFSTQESRLKVLELKGKRLKSKLDGLKEFVTDPSKFATTSKRYRELSARVGTNYATKGLLNEAISLLDRSKEAKDSGDENKILGVRGLWRDLALRIGNATGQKEFMTKAFGESIQDKNNFRVFTKGATTKHIEGLIMEGGKITEQERELGLSISGALSDSIFAGIFEDPAVTSRKLRGFSESLDRDINSRFNEMQGIESDWINRYSDLEKLKLDRLEGTKDRSYGSRLLKGRSGLRIPRSASSAGTTNLRFSDIANLNKDGTMTGLKKNWGRVTK